MKNLKIRVVIEDSVYGHTEIGEHVMKIEGGDGLSVMAGSVHAALLEMNRWYSDFYNRTHALEVVAKFTENAALREGRQEEAEKHKEGGDVWKIQNRANELAAENECLKKQVKDLIAQLDKNIERGE